MGNETGNNRGFQGDHGFEKKNEKKEVILYFAIAIWSFDKIMFRQTREVLLQEIIFRDLFDRVGFGSRWKLSAPLVHFQY